MCTHPFKWYTAIGDYVSYVPLQVKYKEESPCSVYFQPRTVCLKAVAHQGFLARLLGAILLETVGIEPVTI